MDDDDAIKTLELKLGKRWPTIEKAKADAIQVRNLLSSSINDSLKASLGSDLDVVVFGSLARDEWTSGSDVDWTLLIDGQVDANHQQTYHGIQEAISEVEFQGRPLKPPGSSGLFGSLTFSHDLVHLIGGDADSNRNTTRRILMLLESFPISSSKELRAFGRTNCAIIERYLSSDANVVRSGSGVPRFLLNDIVRFWRTMCVDFAWKEWDQAGQKWALRNIKLRMSRKLLFASGLLMVFSCRKYTNEWPFETTVNKYELWHILVRRMQRSPTTKIVETLSELGLDANAGEILDCYERFLENLDDSQFRESLGKLNATNAYQSEEFVEMQTISHDFQNALARLFFDAHPELSEFTRTYGVF